MLYRKTSGIDMNAALLIAKYEGFRERAYLCSEGYPTIGYGKKIGRRGDSLECYDFIIPERVAAYWLKHDIDQLAPMVNNLCAGLDGARHAALISMCYQLGYSGLCKFKNMLAALNDQDWQRAHDEALNSRWAMQTPARAKETAEILLTGQWPR